MSRVEILRISSQERRIDCHASMEPRKSFIPFRAIQSFVVEIDDAEIDDAVAYGT